VVARRAEGSGAWRALVACAITIILAAGSRTSLAAFLRPIETDLHLDRAVLSTAGGLTVLTYGLAQPLVGALSSKYGPRNVMLGGVILTALGGLGVSTANEPWQLYLYAGIIPGLAFAGASTVPATVLVAGWFLQRMGLATGIISAAIPAGQSLFVPLATALIPSFGWRQTYILLGVVVLIIGIPVLLGLARDPPVLAMHAPPETASSASARPGLDVWLLGLGYFGCGFSDQFISIHFVALASDGGIDPLLAAGMLSLLLIIGMLGSVASGPIADRTPPKFLLAALYLLRAVSLPLLLVAGPAGGLVALGVFAVLFGPTYIANQAPGARMIRDRYGVRAVGVLMGSVGLAHQVGGALGVGAGGFSVAELGGYAPAVWLVALIVLVGGVAQLWIPAQRSPVLATAIAEQR
jgi:sugar phosphate permease